MAAGLYPPPCRRASQADNVLDRPVKKNPFIRNGGAGPTLPLTRQRLQPILSVLPRPLRRGRRASLGGRLCVLQSRTGLSGGIPDSWAARRPNRQSWLWLPPDWTTVFSGSWNLARSGSVAEPGSLAWCASDGSVLKKSNTTCPVLAERGLRTSTATEHGERSPTRGERNKPPSRPKPASPPPGFGRHGDSLAAIPTPLYSVPDLKGPPAAAAAWREAGRARQTTWPGSLVSAEGKVLGKVKGDDRSRRP
jgi:hypothetical protein